MKIKTNRIRWFDLELEKNHTHLLKIDFGAVEKHVRIIIKLFAKIFCGKSDPEMHPLEIINIALIHLIHNVKSFINFSVKMYQR